MEKPEQRPISKRKVKVMGKAIQKPIPKRTAKHIRKNEFHRPGNVR
jgi:hypothetical protein